MTESLATRFVARIAETAARFPKLVVAAAVALTLCLVGYARGLELRSDLAELLPSDSPAFRAFEHQAARAGGGASLLIVVSSPNERANKRFADDLGAALADLARQRPDLAAYVESNTRDVRSFYESVKWLYLDVSELERIDADLDRQVALRSGLVSDLFEDDSAAVTTPSTAPATEKKDALGLGDALSKWDERAKKKEAFPDGYFSAKDGTLVGIRVATNATLAGAAGDALLREVERITKALTPARYDARMQVGFTGDVASAAGEKRALLSEALWATVAAVVVILAAIVLYFRSLEALIVVGAPVAFGVAAAYAFARFAFGYVNSAGAFLGAIIVGNGINYPIVLLSRYEDFRARGMSSERARVESVKNALRAELAGACVASIAYGSLVLTRFRGFAQFGAIGFIGMLLVWASIVPLVPALLALLDRGPRRRSPRPRATLLEWHARFVTRRPYVFLVIAVGLVIAAGMRIPRWIGDPWEYDFGRLGSRSSEVSGAGDWSNKANEVFGGKANIAGALMIADAPEQVPLVAAQILANDARDPKGRMIDEITTIDSALPGTRTEQDAKLAVLSRIRERLTPRVLFELGDEERATVLRARPPETLHILGTNDLPEFVRRRFTERSGTVGTVFYVKPKEDVVFADGRNHLRLSATTDNVRLPDGTVVMTASRSTIFAEMLSSLRRDGPLLSLFSLGGVVIVILLLSRQKRVAVSVLASLAFSVVLLLGGAAVLGERINYVNFIALPITFGIGCEYPFNLADRTRLLDGNVGQAIVRSAGAVLLCSFTTTVGYAALLLSDFQALASFGKLAVLGELACIFAAVALVPALLVALNRARS